VYKVTILLDLESLLKEVLSKKGVIFVSLQACSAFVDFPRVLYAFPCSDANSCLILDCQFRLCYHNEEVQSRKSVSFIAEAPHCKDIEGTRRKCNRNTYPVPPPLCRPYALNEISLVYICVGRMDCLGDSFFSKLR
jgi:hypothetical protein